MRQRTRRGLHLAAAAVIAGIAAVALLPSDQPMPPADEAAMAKSNDARVLDESVGICCLADDGSGYYSSTC